MSTSDSDDSYEYETYGIEWYEEHEGPPLIKKRSRLIAAVVQNEVGVLSDLLDSPRWYNVRDLDGYDLLQIAILRDNIEVFDYMLSIPDYPFEFENKYGQTAFVVALDGYVSNDVFMTEHFAYELIRKGVCIDKICFEDNAPLHRALDRSYHKTAKLLIQKGADVNLPDCDGESPLDLALSMFDDLTEVVMTLLVYGAEPSVSHFEFSVIHSAPLEVQEALFLYIYDQYSNLELRLDVLLKLAEAKSVLFYYIIECAMKITFQNSSLYTCFRSLCSMNIECLQLVIQKYGGCIEKAFSKTRFINNYYMSGHDKAICLDNLSVLLESELKPSVITFISTLDSSEIFEELIGFGYNEPAITQLICYLLSYGLNIKELDLQIIYRKFGYCELFKKILHMDVQMGIQEGYIKNIIAVFVYDVNMNLDKFFQNYSNYCADSINELLRYFVHPKLNEICYSVRDTVDDSSQDCSQKIPLLIELARNVFREFFIKKFEVRSCKEFYSRLNSLPISKAHKKIITYETKLY